MESQKRWSEGRCSLEFAAHGRRLAQGVHHCLRGEGIVDVCAGPKVHNPGQSNFILVRVMLCCNAQLVYRQKFGASAVNVIIAQVGGLYSFSQQAVQAPNHATRQNSRCTMGAANKRYICWCIE